MGSDRRSTDAQVLLLQQELDNHIEEFHEHCKSEDARWDKFISTQESNTEQIKQLVQSNKELSDSTRDIVKVWQAADGTVKTMSALGKFIKWLSGLAVVGVAINLVLEHLPK